MGPVAIGLGLIYTGYRVSGPAYRKLIPAICAIAAKRIELASEREMESKPIEEFSEIKAA